MEFLVQTINGSIQHDFAFELQQAKQYYDWCGSEMELSYIDYGDLDKITEPDRYIPIGSVEFVSEYLRKFYGKESPLIPLNVPEELFQFAGRKINNIYTYNDVMPGKYGIMFDIYNYNSVHGNNVKLFRKSLSVIKCGTNGIYDMSDPNNIVGYQVSEILNILSEWRVFVFKGKIQHICNYSGECMVFPDPAVIEDMVKAYTAAPKAWTLDVAVTEEKKTVVIECHRFFSCGLYGFSDHAIIPKMFSQEWFEMKTM